MFHVVQHRERDNESASRYHEPFGHFLRAAPISRNQEYQARRHKQYDGELKEMRSYALVITGYRIKYTQHNKDGCANDKEHCEQ
jgi:hypothetical protein